MKRVKIVAFLLTLMMVFAGCTNSNNSSIDNPNNMQNEPEVNEGKIEPEIIEETQVHEITEEDWKTIDYINANSHLGGIEFMKKVEWNIEDYNEDDFDIEFPDVYREFSSEGLVEGEGYYLPELEGTYICWVEINQNDMESDILGVRNGDKVEDAVKKLKEQGFETYKDYPEYEIGMCIKGTVTVILSYSTNSRYDDEYYISVVSIGLLE